jgi:pyrimidine-specific ribonucleoside hydrolase
LNDGIQISTGATIGQGLITISESILTIPTAIFEFNNVRVKISLKKEIAEQMQQDIKYGVQTYGLLTEKYWLYIEELAIRYWSDYSRIDIFNIEMPAHIVSTLASPHKPSARPNACQ